MSCLKNKKNITFIDTGYYIYWYLGEKYFTRDIIQFLCILHKTEGKLLTQSTKLGAILSLIQLQNRSERSKIWKNRTEKGKISVKITKTELEN